jgi:hypothetical protein
MQSVGKIDDLFTGQVMVEALIQRLRAVAQEANTPVRVVHTDQGAVLAIEDDDDPMTVSERVALNTSREMRLQKKPVHEWARIMSCSSGTVGRLIRAVPRRRLNVVEVALRACYLRTSVEALVLGPEHHRPEWALLHVSRPRVLRNVAVNLRRVCLDYQVELGDVSEAVGRDRGYLYNVVGTPIPIAVECLAQILGIFRVGWSEIIHTQACA